LTKIIQIEAGSGSLAYTSEKRLACFVAVLSTILAAVLLVGAIILLYNVQSQNWRMAIIAIFMVFAATVGLLTSARRAEIFAATAAYAAVLVVFVSGNFRPG